MGEIIQQVQRRMLISLAQVAKDFNLREGDHVLIEERDGGIFIRPVAWHNKNQEYFWTKEWQERMKQSLEDLEKGKYKKYENVGDLLKELGEEEDADNSSD
ncbi:AbrB/MazE/SpoVT family DNA-binding domain-containing protein [Ferviditalea candida]|uniref:AbrB/MazE/SpoVT family DNA-binding domain-containing protein n=1 Tax=Ferviditalea candida TaxID=3108399 RepID=A0ABU5ZIL7_9BACL|nr:AbrB/MazE/SpoVT family DNA-binding domain-containing protein [Paenibacillaceae bacterium T2]